MVRKWRKIATFLFLTFELFVDITIPTKNRPETNGCTSWVCSLCNPRAELSEIGQEIDNTKDILCLGIND